MNPFKHIAYITSDNYKKYLRIYCAVFLCLGTCIGYGSKIIISNDIISIIFVVLFIALSIGIVSRIPHQTKLNKKPTYIMHYAAYTMLCIGVVLGFMIASYINTQ